MRWRRLALVPVLLCVVADLSDPQLPGALSFEIDDCVDGVPSERVRASHDRAVVAPDDRGCALDRPKPEKRVPDAVEAAPRSRGDATPVRDPRYAAERPSPADDH